MCDPEENGKKLMNRVGELGIQNIAYQAEAIGIPMANVRQGICPRCGYQLSYREMFESGMTPHFLCEPCYNLAISMVRTKCLFTGYPLSNQQIQNQHHYPRELEYRISEGLPWDATTVMANIVLGKFRNPFHNVIPDSVYTNQLYHEPQYVNGGERPLALPVPRGNRVFSQSQRQIAYEPEESFDSFFQNSRQRETLFVNRKKRKLWD